VRTKIAHAVLIALLGASAYLSVALLLTSPASAATSSCSDSVTSAPTGPATVSAALDAGIRQGAGHWFGGLPGLFSVPAHLR
jgi:hypothetical protein